MPRKELAVKNKTAKSMKNIPDKKAELDTLKNTEYIQFIQYVMALGAGVEKNNARQMYEAFTKYVSLCSQFGQKIMNISAYAAMGIDKSKATFFRQGKAGKDLQDVMIEVDKVCSMYREILATNGEINNIWAIFTAKNFDGMKDQVDDYAAPTNALGDDVDAVSLMQKYADMPD